MGALSKREIDWWDAQPDAQTCIDCGNIGPKSTVQPQYKRGHALCVDCINDRNRRRTLERKAQLAALPRCELCKRRGTVKTFGVLLCGQHFGHMKREHGRRMAGSGILGLLYPPTYDRAGVLEMARTEGGA